MRINDHFAIHNIHLGSIKIRVYFTSISGANIQNCNEPSASKKMLSGMYK